MESCDGTIECPHHGDGDCREDTTTGAITPPRCPLCQESDTLTPVMLIERGFYASPVHWDADIGDWATDPETREESWTGSETFWACDVCSWEGGDPIGI